MDWTLAASFLNLDFKTSVSAVALGVILAGIIMSLGSKFVAILGWPGLIAIIAVILVAIIISVLVRKRKINKNKYHISSKKSIPIITF